MPSGKCSRIRLPLALALALWMPLGVTGCGTRHHAIPNGATGIVTRKGEVAFPDTDGKTLIPGKYEPVPGDLIRRPKDEAEIRETLKAMGIDVQEIKLP